MKYLVFIFLLIVLYYPFSYVVYSWKKKNKPASVGVMLLTIITAALSGILLFFR